MPHAEPRHRLALFHGLLLAVLLAGCSTDRDDFATQLHVLLGDTALAQAALVLPQRQVLTDFYRQRDFAPLWTDRKGLSPAGLTAIDQLRTAPARHGLDATAYRLKRLQALARRRPAADTRAELELLLGDAVLRYAQDLHGGQLKPHDDPKWGFPKRHLSLAPLLQRLAGAQDIGAALDQLAPADADYRSLLQARRVLAWRRDETWPRLALTGVLRDGERDREVLALRRMLKREGFLSPVSKPVEPEVFDAELGQAVARFQAHHGLVADGHLGPHTRSILNLSPRERLAIVELNLDRHRWLPRERGGRHILVNLPAFRLRAIDSGQTALDMKIVIGQQQQRLQTPAFSETMRYLVINPYWNVPHSITVREIAPQVLSNADYLAANAMEVVHGWGSSMQLLDPARVDWTALARDEDDWSPYRVRQKPGPGNALGRIKFMFPNGFNVYLHDSPARHLFRQTRRTFSHGCIRVERPVDLAAWVLQDTPDWDRKRLQAAIDTGQEQKVDLEASIPVFITYFTARADSDGTLHLLPDIYDRDQPLLGRLRAAGAGIMPSCPSC